MIIAFIVQYYRDIVNMAGRWNNEDFSYCYLVPVIFVYLLYQSKDILKNTEIKSSLWGMAVIIFSCILYLMGNLGSVETLGAVSVWITLAGAGLLIFGREIVKKLAFPFIILAFIVPLPPFVNNLFTFRLKLISSALSVKLMQIAGLSVFREGNIIDLGVTQLQVVDACSGLRYVYPLLLMGFIFAYMFHKKWWEKIVIILATIPISVISNALRIAITGYLTANVSKELADGFFHGFSGWLIFVISFLLLVIFSLFIKWIGKSIFKQKDHANIPPDNIDKENRVKDIRHGYILTAAVIFLTAFLLKTTLVSSQITPERKSFKDFPTQIGEWKGKNHYLSQDILDSLWADDYVQLSFQNQKTGDYLLFFIPYYEYQKNRHTAHAPAACLLGSGYAPMEKGVLKRGFPAPFGEVEIGRMVLEKDGNLLLSNFWFHGRGRVTAGEYLNKWYLFLDSVTKRRTDGALVRIEMPLREGQSIEDAQMTIDGFTLEVLKILPEYVRE